jgi:hypothetical protein
VKKVKSNRRPKPIPWGEHPTVDLGCQKLLSDLFGRIQVASLCADACQCIKDDLDSGEVSEEAVDKLNEALERWADVTSKKMNIDRLEG